MIDVQRLADIDANAVCNRRQSRNEAVAQDVARIVADVRTEGDAALQRWTESLDGVRLEQPFLDRNKWDAGAAACPADVRAAIDGNLQRIRTFHAEQVPRASTMEVTPGVTLGRRPVPLARAACYVPGGRASYPSTVLMTVVPAALAGVERIIVVTPPGADGAVDPAVLYAAKAAGATDILRAGGAQAIAALALGTEQVPRVDCIVGPGNAYVTAAKQQLQSEVRIDSPAGPSELLVLADASANAQWIAADMVAQAEHDPDAQCILLATDEALAQAVAEELPARARAASRSETILASLQQHGLIATAGASDLVAFANDYAAEHVEIHTTNASALAQQIRNAGSIFIGPYAPVPVGDYGSGTNHVLPTMGYAATTGGLGVEDFCKWVTWQELTLEGLHSIRSDVVTLARAEGLHGHADAVEARL